MRKFFILFACSILCVISGLGIFGLELSKIKENVQYVHGNKVTYVTTLSNKAKEIDFTSNYSNALYAGYDLNLKDDQLQIKDVKEDKNLDPNAIEITYSNALKMQKSHNGQDRHFLAIHFQMKESKNKENANEHFINSMIDSWKTKEVKLQKISDQDKVVSIRYGSNLKDKIKIHQGTNV